MYLLESLWFYAKFEAATAFYDSYIYHTKVILASYAVAPSMTKTCRNHFLSDTGSGYFWITVTNTFQILNTWSGYHFRLSMKLEVAWIIFVHAKSSISITCTLFWSECAPQAWIKRLVTLRTPQISGVKGRRRSIGCEFYNNRRKRLAKSIEIKICDRKINIKIKSYY